MKIYMKLLVIAAVVAAGFFSCAVEEGVEIKERIDDFMAALNAGNYSNLYKHFHPTETSNYDGIKDPSFWNTDFPSGETYTLATYVPAETTVTTISSSLGKYSGDTITFVMAKRDDDYFIKSITIGTTNVVWSRSR